MSTTDFCGTRAGSARFLLTLAGSALVVAALAVALTAVGHPDTASGAVIGGGMAIGLAVVARYRAVRRADVAGPGSRIGAGVADERDRRILTAALATTGYASFLTLTGTSVAVAAGMDPIAVVGVATFVQIGVLALAFVVAARRS